MEGSEQQDQATAEPQGSQKRKKARAHVQYVALVENGQGWTLIANNQSGNPEVWNAYRAADVVADVIEENLVETDDEGRTPFIVAIPLRSWRPQRATVATRQQISLSTD